MTLAIIVLLLATVFLDYYVAATGHLEFVIAVELIGAILALPVWRLTRERGPLAAFVLLTIVVLMLRFAPLSPGGSYHVFYKGVRYGTTQAKVLSQFDEHFPNRTIDGHPYLSKQSADSLVIVRDPHDGRYNAELIVIDFKNGVVVSKRYLPD